VTNNELNSEKILLKKAARGDEKAFVQLFHVYKYKLFGYLYKLTGSPEMAEDVVQEVFLRLWKNRHELGEIENLNAYLFRMAQNNAINAFRKAAREIVMLNEMGREVESAVTATDALAMKEVEQIVKRTVESLPAQQRLVYTLSREQGLKHEEIARQLKISPGTVKNHMIQALRTLREELGKYPHASAAMFFFLSIIAAFEK